MNESPDLSGVVLSFGVAGAGVAIDPATGVLSILAEALRDGVEVMVTAGHADGTAARFRVTVAAVLAGGAAPAVATAPALAGDARIGAAVALDPGTWSGDPAPALAFQWYRDGAAIAGATADTYVPAPEDDLAALSCRVVATNAAGSAEAETVALVVTWPAPVAAGGLPDLQLDQGSGAPAVEAAGAFSGGGLVFAADGAGATADPTTGRVTVPTDTLVAAETVTVSAANSGGAASVGFSVGVAAAVLPPTASGAIADVAYALGSGPQTVSAQAAFAGSGLGFALDEAPAGVTIDPGSGLVTITTGTERAAATVTVRAANAAGAVTRSFAVTVAPAATAFDAAGALAELGFLHAGAAPSLEAGDGFARLVPAGRTHGAWTRAAGDGLYRALVRWGSADAGSADVGAAGPSPFALGARVRLDGADFAGVYLDVFQPAAGARQLRLLEYTGSGAIATPLRQAASDWAWDTWYWVEMAVSGAVVKARLYAEAAAVPGWQIEARTAAEGPGAFGPGGLPGAGASATVDIRRLEYHPPEAMPAAPQDGDWTLMQITEQA